MNSVKMLVGAIAAAAALSVPAAHAQDPLIAEDAIPGQFSANVALTNEYVFRGISQTAGRMPALQGGFDYEVGVGSGVDVYAGVWGSNLNFGGTFPERRAKLELDVYGGLKGEAAGLDWDVGAIYYIYPRVPSRFDYNFVEIYGALGHDFGFAAATASVNYSPDFFGGTGRAFYPALALDVPVGRYFVINGHVGYQTIRRDLDYLDWSLGATVNLFGFDVSAKWTDTNKRKALDSGHFVVAVSRTF